MPPEDAFGARRIFTFPPRPMAQTPAAMRRRMRRGNRGRHRGAPDEGGVTPPPVVPTGPMLLAQLEGTAVDDLNIVTRQKQGAKVENLAFSANGGTATVNLRTRTGDNDTTVQFLSGANLRAALADAWLVLKVGGVEVGRVAVGSVIADTLEQEDVDGTFDTGDDVVLEVWDEEPAAAPANLEFEAALTLGGVLSFVRYDRSATFALGGQSGVTWNTVRYTTGGAIDMAFIQPQGHSIPSDSTKWGVTLLNDVEVDRRTNLGGANPFSYQIAAPMPRPSSGDTITFRIYDREPPA